MSEIAGIRPVERAAGAPSPIEAVSAPQSPRRAADGSSDAARDATRLDPAVTLDIGRDAPSDEPERGGQGEYRGRYVKAPESQQIVFQVIDPGTGTVVIQLPSPQAVEARTYAEATAARAAQAAETAARRQPVDLTA